MSDLFAGTPANARQLDLNNPTDRKRLAAQIKDDIDAYALKVFDDGHRAHLGASVIGDECTRRIWNAWRWLRKEPHDGRMKRLFNRGHLEEHRFISFLVGVGFEVRPYAQRLILNEQHGGYAAVEWDVPLNADELDVTLNAGHVDYAKMRGVELKQWRIADVGGHFGGSLDGLCLAPARYNIAEPLVFLNEFKTSGTGKKFVELVKSGVQVAKHQHYVQMCTYGPRYGARFGVYLCVNKNDDDLYVEIVPLDPRESPDILRKAEHIIRSQVPPERIAESEAFWTCKSCHFAGICFRQQLPEKNCRSCIHAVPVPGPAWHCGHWNGVIPDNTIPVGCNDWKPIVNG